ncbi:MAG: metallophosphoesterase [Gemmataceae bacterium]
MERTLALWIVFVAAWVGHAALWTWLLNILYGRPFSKKFLKPWRHFTGLVIVSFPLTLVLLPAANLYEVPLALFGGVFFPLHTLRRALRPRPPVVGAEHSQTIDFWPRHGPALIGNGRMPWAVRLPFTCAFKVDYTETLLKLPHLPPAWDGLRIQLLSDFHFHGTPSELFFQAVIKELQSQPVPDLVVLAGDYLDSHQHHDWMERLLQPLRWREAGLAILGNHDAPYNPYRSREILAGLGYEVLSGQWQVRSIRGVPVVLAGHEGPWFKQIPDLSMAPSEPFRLCVSHAPDPFYWAQKHHVNLMLCGHVHGGQIRVPVVGSIFIPSVYSRRFDEGIFQEGPTTMVVNRGLSGKEPLRFRCHAQVRTLILKPLDQTVSDAAGS